MARRRTTSSGFNLNIPIRNRIAKADQFRSELEYRQAQVAPRAIEEADPHRSTQRAVCLRTGRCAGGSRGQGARPGPAHLRYHEEGAGAGSGIDYQTLTAQRDLALAALDLVNAQTTYQKSKVELDRATGSTLEHNDIQIDEAVKDVHRAGPERRNAERATKFHQPRQAGRRIDDAEYFAAYPKIVAPARAERAARILAADDQEHILDALEILLRRRATAWTRAKSPVLVREAAEQQVLRRAAAST